MSENSLKNLLGSGESTDLMPVLFVGHGSPMNAIDENEFVLSWRSLGDSIAKPKAILCISAHWETAGTFVTAMSRPPTIHDFGGFPPALYNVQYPAPGDPGLAADVRSTVTSAEIGLDQKWGLDHGAWSVIRNIYPAADVPVIELSLNWHLTPMDHYNLAKELVPLREKGVLIVGSGNMVHNLRMIAWDHSDDPEYGFDWAHKANSIFKDLIIKGNHDKLINYSALDREVQMAVPTPDHYLPLLYALALKKENDPVAFFNDKAVMGSLTMTSLKIG
jgi:4,5-DOPA dioxygenase extradiol